MKLKQRSAKNGGKNARRQPNDDDGRNNNSCGGSEASNPNNNEVKKQHNGIEKAKRLEKKEEERWRQQTGDCTEGSDGTKMRKEKEKKISKMTNKIPTRSSNGYHKQCAMYAKNV